MSARVLARTLSLVVLAMTAPALGTPALGEVRTSAVPSDVGVWLARASAAQAQLAYSGTQLVSAWDGRTGYSQVLDVVHLPGRGLTTRPHGADSGTLTAGRDGEDLTVPDRPIGTSYLADAAGRTLAPLSLLTSRYQVVNEAAGPVAGRPTRGLLVSRGSAAVARLWLDQATGLLLRREVYDSAGRTVALSAFLDIALGPRAPVPLTQVALAGRSWAPSVVGVAAVRRAGWACPRQLGADLVLFDARSLQPAATASPVMQLSYSDGLSSVSVFQQRGRLDQAAVADYELRDVGGHRIRVQPGLPARAVWQAGGTVVTVVADDPGEPLAQTVAEVVAAVPPAEPAASGWLADAARTILRAARWLTPLT